MYGVIFSDRDAQLIFEGVKTQYRSIVRPQPSMDDFTVAELEDGLRKTYSYGIVAIYAQEGVMTSRGLVVVDIPYGNKGEVMYVKETFRLFNIDDKKSTASIGYVGTHMTRKEVYIPYSLNSSVAHTSNKTNYLHPKLPCYRPARSMPEWASRSSILINYITIDRLQDITIEDARDDIGVTPRKCSSNCRECKCMYCDPIPPFKLKWDNRNRKGYKWEDNPWVWVRHFTLL